MDQKKSNGRPGKYAPSPLFAPMLSAWAVLAALAPTASGATPPVEVILPQCPLTAPSLEGPFHVETAIQRRDLSEGKPGVPLSLRIQVVDSGTCTPLPGRVVEVWHADALGLYSGVGMTPPEDTSMRGSQLTDENGVVEFSTLYPGWIPGRAPHIHVRVHLGGQRAFTSQMFFNDLLSSAVYSTLPYAANPAPRVWNAGDPVLNLSPGAVETLFARAEPSSEGVVATFQVSVPE